MSSFDAMKTFEYIDYPSKDSNSMEYRFVNGNDMVNAEVIGAPCGVSNNRIANFTDHKILDIFVYGKCNTYNAGVNEHFSPISIKADGQYIEILNIQAPVDVALYSLTHKIMSKEMNDDNHILDISSLPSGLYILNILNRSIKFIKE
jgi:hypothetical protein